MAHKRAPFVRLSIDFTPAQIEALDAIAQKFADDVQQITGLRMAISKRELFHMLIRQQAERVGVEWPDDYPTHGGPRSKKSGDEGDA